MADVCDRCSGRGVIWNGEREVRCRGRMHQFRLPDRILTEEQWRELQRREATR